MTHDGKSPDPGLQLVVSSAPKSYGGQASFEDRLGFGNRVGLVAAENGATGMSALLP